MAGPASTQIKKASAKARQSMNALDAKALKELMGLYQQAASEIEARILTYGQGGGSIVLADLQNVLGQVNLALQQLTQERNILLNNKLGEAANLGVAPLGNIEAGMSAMARQRIATEALAFVRGFVAADGLQLSDRLWRLDRGAREIIANRIEQGVIQGHSASQAAAEFLGQGQPVPGDIQAKTKDGNAQQLGKAAGALLTKGDGSPMLNAMRVFRTELNRAHGTAYQKGVEQVPGSVGTRFLLSPAHPQTDICDLLAVQNLYGLGPGVYPHGKSPWPAHPNTLSYVEVVFEDEVTAADKAGKETPLEALKKMPADMRAKVIGLGKADLLAAGKLPAKLIHEPLYKVTAKVKESAAANLQKEVLAAQKAVAIAQGKAELQRAIEAANQRAAQWKLDKYAGEKKGYAFQAYQQLQKANLIPANQSPTDTLLQVEKLAASLKQKKQISDALSKYKSAVMADKEPTPAVKALFDSLPEKDKAAFLAKISAAKRAAAKTAADEGQIRYQDLERIGPQAGSNPGGLFKHRATGEEYYIKTPASADAARNEVLAAALYKAAGIDVPDVRLIDVDGKPGVASKIVQGVKKDAAGLRAGKVANVFDGYAIDAWVGNWDVAGLGFDNLLVKDGKGYRIDVGGSLRYRAQGGLKGDAFGPQALDLDSLRNPNTNAQSAAVFAKMTPAQASASAQRLRLIADEDIRKTVQQLGPLDAVENRKLADTLIARKAYILERLAPTDRVAAAPADAGARISDAEFRSIKASRLNGYALSTDKNQIEDQQVLLWVEAEKGGKPQTVAQLKLTEAGAEKLRPLIGSSLSVLSFNDGGTYSSLIESIKGIAIYAKKKEPIRAKDIDRVIAARNAFDAKLKTLESDPKLASLFRDHYQPWIDAAEQAIEAGPGKAYKWIPPKGQLETFQPPPPPEAERGFVKRSGVFQAKEIRRGNARVLDKANYTTGIVLEREYGGVKLRFWPDVPDVPYALRNQLQVVSPGGDPESALRTFKALEDIGLNSARATVADREELYLIQIAYHRRTVWADIRKKIGLKDQSKRIEAMREIISSDAGFDITKSALYKPDGTYQAFGQGRLQTFRPDLDGPEWNKFQQEYRLYHRITQQGEMAQALDRILETGGQMAPTTDRLRRGIQVGGSMSPEADLDSGGASYFFTRIQRQQTAYGHAGIVWKSNLVSRLDSISYASDKFGRTTGNSVMSNRKTGVAEWREAARSGSNETIFKNSLSLFDQMDRIVVPPAEYDAVLEVFKKHGYSSWPDGRALTDVVKKIGSV